MSEPKHTPGPWWINGKQSIRSKNGGYIAKCNWNNGENNAKFIVTACNSHDDMLAALKAVQKAMAPINLGACGFVTLSAAACNMLKPIIDEAIAKAEGRAE